MQKQAILPNVTHRSAQGEDHADELYPRARGAALGLFAAVETVESMRGRQFITNPRASEYTRHLALP